MDKGVSFLNYLLFFLLYILSFYFFYRRNTEIVGFYMLFAVHIGCTIYNISYLRTILEANFIPKIIIASILTSSILYSISLIFMIMLISNMKIKFDKTFGSPIKLPPIYNEKLIEYKNYAIVTFSFCSFIFLIFMMYYDQINFVVKDKIRSMQDVLNYKFPIFVLIVSIIPVIISAFELNTANHFSRLSRQELMK
jgi:hypothetical protein